MSTGRRRGGPLRFLGTTVGGWIGVRVAFAALAPSAALLPIVLAVPHRTPAPVPHDVEHVARAVPIAPPVRLPAPAASRRIAHDWPTPVPSAWLNDDAALMFAAYHPVNGARFHLADAPASEAFVAPPAGDGDPLPGRWSAQAWLFARGGAMRAVAPGGQLGGGQAGVRIVRRLGRHAALAVRVSVPTGEAGAAEAAAGLDWLPFGADAAARVSIERRVALGPRARDAWSAYVAAGFYRALDQALIVDGYAQAGIVGARRRDLFADGAVRAGRRIAAHGDEQLTLGAGAWGAAQPGAERLDIGPRAALSVPIGAAVTSVLALEGRVRVAGAARPGSGLALTLATDF